MTCKDCLHFDACNGNEDFFREQGFNITLVHDTEEAAKACGIFKNKTSYVELPNLKHKQHLWLIYNGRIKNLQFSSYQVRPEFDNLLQIHLYKDGFNWCCNADEIGKTVFLTKEEAEQAVAKYERKR